MKQSTIAILVLVCAIMVNSSAGEYLSPSRSEWCLTAVGKCFEPWSAVDGTRLCNPTTAEIDCKVYGNTKTCLDGVRRNCTEAQLGCYTEVKFVGNVSCYNDYQLSVDIMLKLCGSTKALQSSTNCTGLMREMQDGAGGLDSAVLNATSLTEFCRLANQYLSSQLDKYQAKYGKESATAVIDVGRSQLSSYGCNSAWSIHSPGVATVLPLTLLIAMTLFFFRSAGHGY